MSTPMLEVKNLSVTYDGTIKAVKNVSMEVYQGEVVVFIGSNGAGKTSTLRAINGLIKTSSETNVIYTVDGISTELTKTPCHKMVSMGIAHVPEGRQVFANLTVKENLTMGAYILKDPAEIKARRKKVYDLFPRLRERKSQKAGTLSGGEQQMLAMARALMSNPKLLILDEPSMGLSPLLVGEIFDIIKKVNADGVTVLLVEQNAKMALSIADRAYVLETGNLVLSGTGEELLKNDDVKKAYLGA